MPKMMRTIAVVALTAVGLGVFAFVSRNPATPGRCTEHVPSESVNLVRQLRSVDGGYEIELWSREPFPVRAMPTVLRVGTLDTLAATYGFPANTITFHLSSAEYELLQTGDPILIHHTFIPPQLDEDPNPAGDILTTNGWNLWTFGRFDKSQLDCPRLEVPAPAAA